MSVAYDYQSDMLKIQSIQNKWRDTFGGSAINPGVWTSSIGAGGSISVSGGALTMGSGITANSETSILSNQTFTIPFRCSFGLTLSQRIANQEFFVELISVDRVTGVPDGQNVAGFLFDGTTATAAKYEVSSAGSSRLSASNTFPTTVGGGLYEIEPFADETYFHGRLLDITAGRANSYVRHQQIPNPNAVYKLRLRWRNGATAPASTTSAVVQFVAIQDYAELTAEITAGRGQSVAGQALGVQVVTMPATTPVVGPAAHDAVVSGNPNRIAARAVTANYAAVATGDVADAICTVVGAIITTPFSIPDANWSYAGIAGGITTTADVALRVAGAAGIRNYVTGINMRNAHATVATEVVIKDGASTVLWRGFLPAAMAASQEVQFISPLRGTAATAMNFACITAGAQVYVNAQGFAAP
jgi:hypothetical protein